MKLLELININKYYGSQKVLHNLNLKLNSGEKYALIGPNGCGKTTLLKILTQQEEYNSGTLKIESAVTIGYVPQNITYSDSFSIKEALLEQYQPLIATLREIEDQLALAGPASMERLLEEYQQAREDYDAAECDLLENRLDKSLEALGLGGRQEQALGTLSGGEKSMLGLAAALLKDPDLLILDEPGNHLDYLGLAWLEEFLIQFRGTVLVVSHNRYLIDKVCTAVLELEKGEITTYKGNYSAYYLEKLKKAVNQQADYKADQRKIQRLEALVKRLRILASQIADPGIGQRYRARVTQLRMAKQDGVEKPELDKSKINVELASHNPKARIALQIKDYDKSFGKLQLFSAANAEIFCGEKVGLLGPNGCGKSSLIKEIVEKADWENPLLRLGPSMKLGYLSQKQELDHADWTIEEEMRGLGPLTKDEAFGLVSPFLFTYQDMGKKLGQLSGGEFNRLQLAKLRYLQANFLILDEPSNHLDIPSREAIEEALLDFDGTILLISHDRYLLDKVVERVIEVRDQKLIAHQGSFSEYWSSTVGLKATAKGRTQNREKERGKAAGSPKTRGETGAELQRVENQLMEAEQQKLRFEKQIAQAFHRGDHVQGRDLSKKLTKHLKLLDSLYVRWEDLAN